MKVITKVEVIETGNDYPFKYIAKRDMNYLWLENSYTVVAPDIDCEVISGMRLVNHERDREAHIGFSEGAINGLSPLLDLIIPRFPQIKLDIAVANDLIRENRELHGKLLELKKDQDVTRDHLKKEVVTLLKDLAKISASREKTALQVCILAMEALDRAEARAQEI